METKFFHQLDTPLEAFVHMKTPRRDKKDKKRVTVTFRMPLDGNIVRSAPEFIRTGYLGVKEHGEDFVGMKKEIENVDIQVFELPNKRQKQVYEFTGAHLEKLAVKEIKSGKGDPSIVLTFEFIYPWDTTVWRFLGAHYATTVFLKFDSAQASLLDLPDESAEDEEEEDEDQPTLPQTEMPKSGKDAAAGE